MRILPWLAIIALLFSTFWFRKQQAMTQAQLNTLTDTLAYFRLNHPNLTEEWYISGLDSIIGPKPLELGDSLQEIHRILWTTSNAFSFLIKEKKNGSVWLDYRRFTIQNPLTKAGPIKVLSAKIIPVPIEAFNKFRQKLASISFFDATRHESYICCFATGSLGWDAKFQKEGRLKLAVSCRQSVQFAEACEMMMRLVDDPDLQHALAFAAKG